MSLPTGYEESDCSDMGECIWCAECCERCDLDTYAVKHEVYTPEPFRYTVRYFCSDRCAQSDAKRGGRSPLRGEDAADARADYQHDAAIDRALEDR